MLSPARRYPEWCLVTVNCTNTNTKSDKPRLHSLVPMGTSLHRDFTRHLHFGLMSISKLAHFGLRFPVFPEPEEVIPDNETLIHRFSVIFTSKNMRRYLGVFGPRKAGTYGFSAEPAFLPGWKCYQVLSEPADFSVGE